MELLQQLMMLQKNYWLMPLLRNLVSNTDNKEVIFNNPFDGLEGRLLRWFNTCLKEKNDDKRLSMWL